MNISDKKLRRGEEYIETTPIVYRTATPISLEKVSFVGKTAQIAVRISHYQDEERTIKDTAFEDVIVFLTINNTEPYIDKTSGQYATEQTALENLQGEFDFFMTQKLASIEEMLVMGIARADALNRFD